MCISNGLNFFGFDVLNFFVLKFFGKLQFKFCVLYISYFKVKGTFTRWSKVERDHFYCVVIHFLKLVLQVENEKKKAFLVLLNLLYKTRILHLYIP